MINTKKKQSVGKRKIISKAKIRKLKNEILDNIGYQKLKPEKELGFIETIKLKIRKRKGRELEAEIENIMFNCGLYNSYGDYAKHLGTTKKSDNHYITMWKIPRGLTHKHFINKQNVFADNLIAQVNIEERKGNLMIEVIKGNIPSKVNYNYNYDNYKDNMIIPIPMGYDQSGLRVLDLTKVHNILIAGVIGSGKSVCMMQMLDSLLQCDNVNLFVIDFAMTDFYHARNNVIFAGNFNEAEMIISFLIHEMNRRAKILVEHNVNQIIKYNENYPDKKIPHLVCIIDEFAFTSPKMVRNREAKIRREDLQDMIAQIAQKGRKYGVHLIIGMQRPSEDLMPMIVKSQMPLKIAFKVENFGTSRTILGNDDAYYLPSIPGRMIYQFGSKQQEVQCMYLSQEQSEKRMKELPVRKDDNYVRWANENEEERLLPR